MRHSRFSDGKVSLLKQTILSMRYFFTTTFLIIFSFSSCVSSFAQSSQTAYVYNLEMNDSLNVWNDGQWVDLEDRKAYKTKLHVYNICKGHRGATGKFVIDMRNKGPKDFVAWVMLVPGNTTKYKLETNNAARVSLRPGEKVSN
jgi:hypothetical protein